MQNSEPVSVVVVAFNSGRGLLDALRSATLAGASELIVIDNASVDGAVTQAQQAFPALRVRRQNKNTGFAKASNLGLSLAQHPYVLFLNDDATIRPDYLSKLRAALRNDPQAAGAMGKLLVRDEPAPRIDSAGIQLRPWSWSARDRGAQEIDVGQYDEPTTPFGITGAAALYRTEVLRAFAGFDERLVSYYEDVELAWRLNKAGYHHLYRPEAEAYHARRNLVGKELAIVERAHLNRYRVWFRHESKRRWISTLMMAMPRECVRAVRLAWHDRRSAQALYAKVPGVIGLALRERSETRSKKKTQGLQT